MQITTLGYCEISDVHEWWNIEASDAEGWTNSIIAEVYWRGHVSLLTLFRFYSCADTGNTQY